MKDQYTTPMCFSGVEQFNDWKSRAQQSGEVCTICDDCTREYELAMVLDQRCERREWQRVLFGGSKVLARINKGLK